MAITGENFIQVLKAIPPGKMISFSIIVSIVVGGFIALLLWTNRPDYQVLFSNLDTGDAAKISEKLKEKRVLFQLKDGGRAILVPDDMVYQLRLELASEGIPTGSSVGFEIFDEISFGTTEFVQKLKYQQALQGELARTIMQFDVIDQARVHIVASGDSLFAEPERPSTASVVIRPQAGRTLNQRQLQGIINLVACAVKGLKPENVTVVDMSGGMLSKGHDEDGVGDRSNAQFDYQKKIEDNYIKRIQTMLEPVVGLNRVVARVSAEVDFRQINISEEKFDPDSVVIRSEQRQQESSSSGKTLPSGSPDMKYQVYQSQEGSTESSVGNFKRENSVINYEINKVNRQIIDSVGDIKRLSAAVIIDGPYVSEKDAEGNIVQKFAPRSRKEMKSFEDIIKKVIGFNEARGDQVNVSNISFSLQEEEESFIESKPGWMSYVKKRSKPVFNILLVLLFFLLAIRPFKRWLNQTGEYVSTLALRQGKEGSGLDSQTDELQMRQNSRQQLIDVTKKNPDVAADIIKTWINEVT
ncbi:MAG: flagellar M-ring protein FliF [Deltaproteobacteria bacterium]|nr:flagellar M-ring protein FliF [Deltaproteobacteria bacterium]